MITSISYDCEFCGRSFTSADECVDHEMDCKHRIKFYNIFCNRVDASNNLCNVSYIYVPSYKEYVKLINRFPNTAVLENNSNYKYPFIILRTTLKKTEWMLFEDYCEEIERLKK